MTRHTIIAALCLSLVGAVSGCDDHDHEGESHEDESPAAHACEHLDGGESKSVAATDFASKAYPDVSAAHTLYTIALDDEDGDGLLYVRYEAAEAGDHVLFLTGDVPVAVTGPDGNQVEFEESGGSPEDCPDFLAHHVMEFEIGSYTIELGPTELSEVGLVVYVGGHEHDEDE